MLLKHRNVTLEEVPIKACAWEAACRQATNIDTSLREVGDNVDAVKGRQDKEGDKNQRCYNCGREGKFSGIATV